MHNIIIGGGEVGMELAFGFQADQQPFMIIEKDPAIADEIEAQVDAVVIRDNGASAEVLEKARVKQARAVIAVTEMDEINIFACMLAKNVGVPFTVARIRNPECIGSGRGWTINTEAIGIDMVINPERAAGQEIAKMIHFPDAFDIEYYVRGKVMLTSVEVSKDREDIHRPLRDLKMPKDCIVAGIRRPDGAFRIPGGDDAVEPGDQVYLMGTREAMPRAGWFFHPDLTRIRRVVIMGGGMIGRHLAEVLAEETKGLITKIIDKDPESCEEMSCCLKKAIVLPGDRTDLSFFNVEEIGDADVLACVTGDDQVNLIAALLGKREGVLRVICEVHDMEFTPIYRRLGLDQTVNPQRAAARKILRATKEPTAFHSTFGGVPASVAEIRLGEHTGLAGKRIAEAGLPRGFLIGSVVREGDVIIPNGQTVLHPGDTLVVIAYTEVARDIETMLS